MSGATIAGGKPADYIRPQTLDAALTALREVDDARLIAGGTDLMVALRDGRIHPSRLVDISQIAELAEIRDEGDALSIGAAAKVNDVISHPAIRQRYPVLVDAGRLLGGWQIQNMATVGGNLCNASPAAELAGPLLVLDAELDVAGANGSRRIPLHAFWEGPGKTVLGATELVTSIRVPQGVSGQRSAYRRVDIRHSVDIALVSASARLELDGHRVRLARLAFGSVAPVAFRLREAEQLLEKDGISVATLEEVRRLARTAARPISDVRASADYRRAMTGVLAGRVVELALQRSVS